MYQIVAYLKFLFASTNEHGVHSPFVYLLVTTCFYDRKTREAYKDIKTYRNSLLQNKDCLNVEDFGAGSRVFKNTERQIHKIAKTSGSSLKQSKLLHRLINYFNPEHVLELGTSLGIATHAMAISNPKTAITSIEGSTQLAEFATQQIGKRQLSNVHIINGRFEEVLPTLDQTIWDFVFIDGNHSKAATLDYFEQLVEHTHNDSVFIFDDIHWSKDMTEAWQIIKDHPKVRVTIDTFNWGFVFFRKEQAKEHFKIRL